MPPSSWRQATLGEIGDIVTGKTPPAVRAEYFSGHIPFVTPSDFDGRRKIDATARSLTDSGAASVGRALVPPNAVMVSCIGSDMGKAAMSTFTCVTNQQINSLIIGPDADPEFVYYNLSRRKEEIQRVASGSAQPILNKSAFGRIPILLPPLPQQHAIAAILGALDDKIELNRKLSATVEAMARALFKSWFVDFDPVRSKAEGRAPGLPAEIAALFPDSFEDTDHGELPSGWAFATILDIAMLNPEVWSKTTRPDVIRYVDLSTVKWGRFEMPATYDQSEAPSRAQRVLRPGDTLVGTVRPANGSYGLVSDEGLTGSTGFAVLRPTRSTPLTYLAATSKDNIKRLGHLADGGAYPAVRPEVVGGTHFVLPSNNVLWVFDAIALPLLDRYAEADRESRTLTALRDALLPKLISGELRVTDAERVLAASA